MSKNMFQQLLPSVILMSFSKMEKQISPKKGAAGHISALNLSGQCNMKQIPCHWSLEENLIQRSGTQKYHVGKVFGKLYVGISTSKIPVSQV